MNDKKMKKIKQKERMEEGKKVKKNKNEWKKLQGMRRTLMKKMNEEQKYI